MRTVVKGGTIVNEGKTFDGTIVIEDGKITVMDYKTDRVNDAETLISRYRKQLDLYSEALEQLTRLPVREKIIYSVALNKEIVI